MTRRTVIEEGTSLQGTVTSSCPVLVLGRIDGDLAAPEVELAPSGIVVGTIRASTITVADGLLAACELEIGAEPSKVDAIEAALAPPEDVPAVVIEAGEPDDDLWSTPFSGGTR